jgi:hypothetical protein
MRKLVGRRNPGQELKEREQQVFGKEAEGSLRIAGGRARVCGGYPEEGQDKFSEGAADLSPYHPHNASPSPGVHHSPLPTLLPRTRPWEATVLEEKPTLDSFQRKKREEGRRAPMEIRNNGGWELRKKETDRQTEGCSL